MNQEKSVFPGLCLALTSLLGTGCFIDVRGEPHRRPSRATGDITVEWTVDGRADPRACSRYGGRNAEFELLVYQGGREVMRQTAPCDEFRMTIELPADDYTAYATLVDRNENPLTSTLPLEDVEIIRDEELNLDIDFPSGSFLR
jgi:hypothetical protein